MNEIGGRPTVITYDTVRKLEDAFKAGFNVSEACYSAGISRATYYEHKAADEGFSDKMELAKGWVTVQAKHVVVAAIKEGDVPIAKWWLERKARSEFGANAVDEEARWEAQAKATRQDEVLLQFFDKLKDSAEDVTEKVASNAQ